MMVHEILISQGFIWFIVWQYDEEILIIIVIYYKCTVIDLKSAATNFMIATKNRLHLCKLQLIVD